MSDENVLSGMPPWVIPAALFAVVIIATLSGGKGNSSALAQTSYEPTPADPNLTALSAQESNNLTDAFKSVVDFVSTDHVSQLAAGRDIALETMQADSENRKTQAALAATVAGAQAQQNIAQINSDATVNVASVNAGATVAQSYNAYQTAQANAAAQAAIAATNAASAQAIAQTQADATKSVAGSQENATKATSKNSLVGNIVHDVASVGKAILGFL